MGPDSRIGAKTPTNKPKPAINKPKPAVDEPKPAVDEPKLATGEPKPVANELKLAANIESKLAVNKPKPKANESKTVNETKPAVNGSISGDTLLSAQNAYGLESICTRMDECQTSSFRSPTTGDERLRAWYGYKSTVRWHFPNKCYNNSLR